MKMGFFISEFYIIVYLVKNKKIKKLYSVFSIVIMSKTLQFQQILLYFFAVIFNY